MKKHLFISIGWLASILGALPLSAQESCYAQYLREHNMRVLTAEDADDSYDEQKKTVLAWQMYGSEASLPLRPIEEPAAPIQQDTTYVIVHLALVDSTWYMWMSVDPLADKYPGNTPYLYCNGNPIMLVDDHGDTTRLWVETNGVGHTWITTGEENNMVVYSYGRYDDLGKDKESCRSFTLNGDGVLLRLTGEAAQNYQKAKITNTNAMCIIVPDISDAQIQEYFDNIFYSTKETPSNYQSKYYKNSEAHVIDTYHLLYNNCTTKAVQAINAVGSKLFINNYISSPNGRGYDINTYKMFISPLGLYLYLK